MPTFFNLTGPRSDRRLAEWDSRVDLEIRNCPVYAEHRSTGRRTTRLSVILPGAPLEDFVWTWLSECLIQDRVQRFLKREGLTGWQVRRAQGRFRHTGRKAPILWELRVTGWAGLATRESGVELKHRCSYCGLTEYTGFKNPAKLIDVTKWDGSDFFIVWPLPGFIFVTDAVVHALRRAKLKGWRAERLQQMSCENGLSPGCLNW
jgi:hypothetical protein